VEAGGTSKSWLVDFTAQAQIDLKTENYKEKPNAGMGMGVGPQKHLDIIDNMFKFGVK
jgi:hypothetical protein